MEFLKKIVDGIDDSRIVKQAYRAFYYLLGGLLGIGTILCSVYIYTTQLPIPACSSSKLGAR